jgi:hypothetical protein
MHAAVVDMHMVAEHAAAVVAEHAAAVLMLWLHMAAAEHVAAAAVDSTAAADHMAAAEQRAAAVVVDRVAAAAEGANA